MTNEELAQIEARANAATEGPWWRRSRAPGFTVSDRYDNELAFFGTETDADFASFGRTDIPRLIDEVRLQRIRIRDLEAELEEARRAK